jgi:redox-sensitive bicupin YhaK (pirin superfamily)
MFYYRAADQRGKANFGWLDSRHSFSFGSYYDANHMGVSALRVINDDHVTPGAGFEKHGHRDMEIISYILEGSIEHKDSMGNHFVIPAGEVQIMSAGTGVTHSEFNGSQTEDLKFLQIWISPNKKGIQPSYEQMPIVQTSALTPLVTPDGRDGSLRIQQDASLYRLQLQEGEGYELNVGAQAAKHEVGYLHVISGSATGDQYTLKPGDGLGMVKEKLSVTAGPEGLIALWFDLPPL